MLVEGLQPNTQYTFSIGILPSVTNRESPVVGKKRKKRNHWLCSPKCRRRVATRGEEDLVGNGSFEDRGLQEMEHPYDDSYKGLPGHHFPARWQSMMSPIGLCQDLAHSGSASLCLHAPNKAGYNFGASQYVLLNQTSINEGSSWTQFLVLSAWSAAKEVSGKMDGGYSINLHIKYQDETFSYGQKLAWATGDHHWQRQCVVLEISKPIHSVHLFVLFMEHSGQVWFDDVQLFSLSSDPAGE